MAIVVELFDMHFSMEENVNILAYSEEKPL